ncbi:cytochrome P450 [Streptomyces sp. DSM 44917]|uniref:Cytochrome P450 n=1 Tax=Streptomyces boetiae TaxID=3075541 RepID=A0ABU2LCV5_9ACTN|nr:cytochrome P450 [Streptomyces sp. DSM 44917]MDT0309127.1 cytochrome P450 [Streptomyces sp. DSM 44917]
MTEATTYTTVRDGIFHPAARLRMLRAERPLARMTFADGHEGWLITGYALARAVLADPRFSARGELKHQPVARAAMPEKPPAAPPGMFIQHDGAEHQRYRKLLVGQFTVRRMRQLTDWIERITEEHLDRLEEAGPPADLFESFALPIPSLVIAELLGVPVEDRERFQEDSAVWSSFETDMEGTARAFFGLTGYLGGIVAQRRAEPRDDIISGLIRDDPTLTDEELTAIAYLLLVAGHETTANQTALGVLALLTDPEQLAAVRADLTRVDATVEELLRYLSIVHHGPSRAALEDVELGGHRIRKGEVVMISLAAANRDPDRFEDPEALDVSRPPVTHLGFGHGAHQCLGQQLARIELRVGLSALLRRLPGLRLAVPPEEIRLRHDMQVYGVYELPVTW